MVTFCGLSRYDFSRALKRSWQALQSVASRLSRRAHFFTMPSPEEQLAILKRGAANWLKRQPNSAAELIAGIYLQALSRPPSEAELRDSLAYIAESENLRQGLEDLCWALVNSKEFLFQH